MAIPAPAALSVQDTTLLLLIRVNRLLEEAEALRAYRDQLIAATKATTPEMPREGATQA